MKRLQGKRINAGIATGKILLMKSRPAVLKQEIPDPEQEVARLLDALTRAEEQLQTEMKTADKTAAGILETHMMLLTDTRFRDTVTGIIRREHVNAEYAADRAGETLAEEFEAMEDPYLRARSEDMRQTARRAADCLTGFTEVPRMAEPVILCAEEFTPALLSGMNREYVLGLAAKTGSPVSHTAILAAGYGLPYLAGIDPAEINDGVTAVLDADHGELILEPDPETEQKAKEKEKALREMTRIAPEKTRMKVYANIASEKDLETVLRHQADGIGLFRTEFLFMNRNEAPDEEEQFQVYRRVLEAMEGRETIIRTIDAGTDKPVPYLDMPREENPALGLRGARVSLAYPDLFRVQLRALLRAACYGNEGIMFPMITSGREIMRLREQVNIAAGELDARKEKYRIPRIGIMVETPAAALVSEELAKQADFFSVGTNDLTQYTLALDRLARGMDDYYDPHHDAVLKLIRMTVEGGHKAGIPVGICGQLGADPELIPLFVGEGLDEVSVAPASVPAVRYRVAEAEKQHENRTDDKPGDGGIHAPADGQLVSMSGIPDPVFAGGVLGPCFGIIPDNGLVRAPASGTVSSVADTGHAVSLRTSDGKEILIHTGIDTVQMKGRGFSPKVKQGDTVRTGDTLLEFDPEAVREAGLNPMVITVLM